MIDYSFRHPTTYESRLIEALLDSKFPGCDELTAQFQVSKVRTFDENGSFEFNCESATCADSVIHAVPAEGECEDVDEVVIHLLLHVKNSYLWGLEIHKEDNSKVDRLPDLGEIRIFAAQ